MNLKNNNLETDLDEQVVDAEEEEIDFLHFTLRPPKFYIYIGLAGLFVPGIMIFADIKANGHSDLGMLIFCLILSIIPILLILVPLPGIWEIEVDGDDINIIKFDVVTRHFKMSEIERLERTNGDYKCYVKGRSRVAFTVDVFCENLILFLARLDDLGIEETNSAREISINNPIKVPKSFVVKKNKTIIVFCWIVLVCIMLFLFVAIAGLLLSIEEIKEEGLLVDRLIIFGILIPGALLLLTLKQILFKISVDGNLLVYRSLFKTKTYDLLEIKYRKKKKTGESQGFSPDTYKYTYYDMDGKKLFSITNLDRNWNLLVYKLSHCKAYENLR